MTFVAIGTLRVKMAKDVGISLKCHFSCSKNQYLSNLSSLTLRKHCNSGLFRTLVRSA